MENPEEILHSLEEFAKLKPKDIPRELEDYLCFVAKTGDPVYQWSAVKSLFREKLINVITEFYESCPSVEIPPCPNVEMFNYDSMKNFILEKLDTFASAPFTVQRICELLTTPRKEYNRIDKYMRALEKNILVVSTTEPGNRRNTENGEGIVNGIETEHLTEANSSNDINVEEMDDSPSWPRISQPESNSFVVTENSNLESQPIISEPSHETVEPAISNESRLTLPEASTSSTDSVITSTANEKPFISIEPVVTESKPDFNQDETSVTITAIPAPVQKRRDSIEPLTSDDNAVSEAVSISQEEVIPTEIIEGKPDIAINESTDKPAFENIPLDLESDKVKDENNIDEKDIDEKDINEEPVRECVDNLQSVPEETSDISTSSDDVTVTEKQNEEVVTDPCSKNEPETEEICDSTQSIENTNNFVEEPNIQLPETVVDTIPKPTEPNTDLAEASTTEESCNTVINSDAIEESIKEDSQKTDLPLTESKSEPIKEEALSETPMEIDPDESLKESSLEASSEDAKSD